MFASLRRVFIANVRHKKIWIVVYPLALRKNIYINREIHSKCCIHIVKTNDFVYLL